MSYVGILELNSGKTYGRQIRTTKKEGRLMYGIRHNYVGMPPLKAPYDIRGQQKSCSRYAKDKYVLFRIVDDTWKENADQLQSRPEAQLVETIGDVDDTEAFGNFLTHLSGMKLSSSWAKELSHSRTKDIPQPTQATVSEATNSINVFTIDPVGCKDMDDAIGITKADAHTHVIHVAITHVPSFLVMSGIDSKGLIGGLGNTCSLYMPHGRVVNMMPKHVAENACSFKAGNTKRALVMKVAWNDYDKSVTETSLAISDVFVTHNYAYDTAELVALQDYQSLFSCVKALSSSHRHFAACPIISDSHDVVAYLMTLMNFYVMEWLEQRNLPCVYRVNRTRGDKVIPDSLNHLRQKIGNYAGEYCSEADELRATRGNDVTVWTHITSPMRRLADLTNMLTISIYTYPNQYKDLVGFRDHCIGEIARMSREYKASRHLSMDCELFSVVKQMTDDGTILSRAFSGVVTDVDDTRAVVYVEELSRFFRTCVEPGSVEMFAAVSCTVVGFGEGHTINEKVRLVITEN